jgi:heme/copper-type cytochrome/quinol oxidase subunit 1
LSTTSPEQQLIKIWETPKGLWGSLATVDHKVIGLRYLVTAMIFLMIGGLEALVIRLQLAHADNRLISPETYTMIFW